jgi:hypothetical protein
MIERFEQLKRGECTSHILPFLWMKGEDTLTICEELDRIEECGIKELCLESRPYPDFCGPRWWETMDFLVPEAKKRGMKLWILDDRKFPTGYANGGFERNPEHEKIYLAERHMDIMGPCKDGAVLVENFLQPDGKLLGILACPKPDTQTLGVSADGILDLTNQVKNGFVYFDLPEGAYRFFILFTTKKGGGREHYMNLIDRKSVRVLIDEVYEKHYAHYRDYFGNTIAGFFSDEPELGNINGYPFDAGLGRRDVRLPWSEELSDHLHEQWKDEFLKNLPALWYDMDEKTGRVRTQYMEHLTDLVYRCFSSQIGDWCSAHGVEYIGHIIEDDNAHTRLACSIGHYFKEMKGQHMAGVDVVHHQIVQGFTGKIHQWIAGDSDGEFFHFGLAKLASSASHLDEKKKNRALCEIFGNYGWAEGVSFMKWLTNHMLVRGINEFTPHAFSMTYPDRDCPPHFYARGNNPQFPAFAQLMHYMQRAAHLLTDGQPLIDVAVLYHAESEWSAKAYQLFQKPMRALMERQIDCDVIPAQAFSQAYVENGELHIGKMTYSCLVMPGAVCEDRQVAAFVIEAAKKGLLVYTVDQIPAYDTYGNLLPEAFKESVQETILEELPVRIRKEAGSYATVLTDSDAQNTVHDLRLYQTAHGDARVIMLFNESSTKSISGTIVFEKTKKPLLSAVQYSPWSNTAEHFGILENKLSILLAPGEAQFFVLETTPCSSQRRQKQSEMAVDANWEISRCDELHYGEFEPFIKIKQESELVNLNGPKFDPCFTGFYRYETDVIVEKKKEVRYFLRLEKGGDTAQIFVNGVDCGYQANFPDRTEITDALTDGENKLCLEFSTTLVWKRKDGASTHLQLSGTGLLASPVIECWSEQ